MYASESCNVSVAQCQRIPACVRECNAARKISRKNRRYLKIESKPLGGAELSGPRNPGPAANHASESSVIVNRVAIDGDTARSLRANESARSDQGELLARRY